MLLGVAAQYQDAHVGRFGAQHGQRIQPALARHRQVHQQHVDFLVAHEIDGFSAIACLAFHAEVYMLRQVLPQSRANNRMVIHNADLDH
ncbi:hypothetical protein D3C71_1576460 [compost metagenome]